MGKVRKGVEGQVRIYRTLPFETLAFSNATLAKLGGVNVSIWVGFVKLDVFLLVIAMLMANFAFLFSVKETVQNVYVFSCVL